MVREGDRRAAHTCAITGVYVCCRGTYVVVVVVDDDDVDVTVVVVVVVNTRVITDVTHTHFVSFLSNRFQREKGPIFFPKGTLLRETFEFLVLVIRE